MYSNKETRPLNKETFVSTVEGLKSRFSWISEIGRAPSDDEGEIAYLIMGRLDGIEDEIGAVVMYGPPVEEWESADVISIGVPIAQISGHKSSEVFIEDFEERLRERFDLSDFISIDGIRGEKGTVLLFATRYEINREGFDYQEIIEEFLGDMIEALPVALSLF